MIEESDMCPICYDGEMEITLDGPCCCSVISNPPCGACENSYLSCSACGYNDEEIEDILLGYQRMNDMNYSALAAILHEGVTAVKVKFSGTAQLYTYKTTLTLEVGDQVVVPGYKVPYAVAEVKEIDQLVDHESDINYKWIVDKVDLTAYEKTLELEDTMVEQVKLAERKKKRSELAATVKEFLPDEVKQIQFGDHEQVQTPAGSMANEDTIEGQSADVSDTVTG